jgi:hypothetical protein
MHTATLGPTEKQPVAHQGQSRGHDKGGNLFQALDHGVLSGSLHLQFA